MYQANGPLRNAIWRSFLHPSSSHDLELRCLDNADGLASLETGCTYVSESPQPLNLNWLGPHDRISAFKPLPLLEAWLQEAAQCTAEAPIPRDLLRELLRDTIPGPASQAALYSNRAEAVLLPDGSWGILAPCGAIGELLRLSTLRPQDPEAASPFIEAGRTVVAVSGAPIHGLHVSPHPHPSGVPVGSPAGSYSRWGPHALAGQAHRLLAVRTPYCLCVQGLVAPLQQDDSGGTGLQQEAEAGRASWGLRPLAAVRSSGRVMDVAWNRVLPHEVAYVEEDGGLYVADVTRCHGQVATGPGGEVYGQMRRTRMAPRLATADLPGGQLPHRFLLQWLPHARLALLAAGGALLRCDMRGKPGCCRQETVHLLPQGDCFRCLAVPRAWADAAGCPSESKAWWGLAPVPCEGGCEHLLAAATTSALLLFDARRFSEPVLSWPLRAGDAVPSHLELRVLPLYRKRTAWSAVPPPAQGDAGEPAGGGGDMGPAPVGAQGTEHKWAPTVGLQKRPVPSEIETRDYLADAAAGPIPASFPEEGPLPHPRGMGGGTRDGVCPPVGTQGSQGGGVLPEETGGARLGTQGDAGAVLEGAILAGDWALGTVTLHRFALGGGSASLAVLPQTAANRGGQPDPEPLAGRLRFTSEPLLGTDGPQGRSSPSRKAEGRVLQAGLATAQGAAVGDPGSGDGFPGGSGAGGMKEKPLFSWTPLLCSAPIRVRPAQLVCRSLRDLPEAERAGQVQPPRGEQDSQDLPDLQGFALLLPDPAPACPPAQPASSARLQSPKGPASPSAYARTSSPQANTHPPATPHSGSCPAWWPDPEPTSPKGPSSPDRPERGSPAWLFRSNAHGDLFATPVAGFSGLRSEAPAPPGRGRAAAWDTARAPVPEEATPSSRLWRGHLRTIPNLLSPITGPEGAPAEAQRTAESFRPDPPGPPGSPAPPLGTTRGTAAAASPGLRGDPGSGAQEREGSGSPAAQREDTSGAEEADGSVGTGRRQRRRSSVPASVPQGPGGSRSGRKGCRSQRARQAEGAKTEGGREAEREDAVAAGAGLQGDDDSGGLLPRSMADALVRRRKFKQAHRKKLEAHAIVPLTRHFPHLRSALGAASPPAQGLARTAAIHEEAAGHAIDRTLNIFFATFKVPVTLEELVWQVQVRGGGRELVRPEAGPRLRRGSSLSQGLASPQPLAISSLRQAFAVGVPDDDLSAFLLQRPPEPDAESRQLEQKVEAAVVQRTEAAGEAAAILRCDGCAPLAGVKPSMAARRAGPASLLPATSSAAPAPPSFPPPPSQETTAAAPAARGGQLKMAAPPPLLRLDKMGGGTVVWRAGGAARDGLEEGWDGWQPSLPPPHLPLSFTKTVKVSESAAARLAALDRAWLLPP